MMFLAEATNTADVTPYLQAEAARVSELQQAGIIEMVLVKADWSGAYLLLRANDLAAARDAVGTLPIVANGLTNVEFTEVLTDESISGVSVDR